jgi:hypothetical protein
MGSEQLLLLLLVQVEVGIALAEHGTQMNM